MLSWARWLCPEGGCKVIFLCCFPFDLFSCWPVPCHFLIIQKSVQNFGLGARLQLLGFPPNCDFKVIKMHLLQ